MSASALKTNAPLLIVDDSDDDIFLLTRALRKTGIPHPIDCAANGAQGINYLRAHIAHHGGSELPSLVLLDLKMPIVDGHEVLAWIRSQPSLEKLPVYVLSSSQLEIDISKSKEGGAADYWVKPSSLPEYQDLADRIKSVLPPAAA
jgi:CheY-like chemotaxis protein